jgi:hypothetical protein
VYLFDQQARMNSQSNLLRKALEAFEPSRPQLDRRAIAVLDRLGGDQRAAKAFSIFDIEPKTAGKIVLACIEADLLAHTFESRLDLERRMLGNRSKSGRLDELERSVADLRAFLEEINQAPVDRLSAWIRYSDDDVAAVKQGLYVLSNALSARRQLAEETLLRLGSTRKSKGNAGETAAIGWIGEVVKSVCGRPHLEAAATIAEVILDCEVTVDRLRGAMQTRRRPWRK